MMKFKIQSSLLLLVISVIGLIQSSCFGEFALIRKIYELNKSIADDGSLEGRFINNIVFWGLFIVPVYEVATLVDGLLLNLIEFWTGSNPLAMQDGEMEQQYICQNGEEYLITATKNQFLIEHLVMGTSVKFQLLQYDPSTLCWKEISDGHHRVLMSFDEVVSTGKIKYFTPSGIKTVTVPEFALIDQI